MRFSTKLMLMLLVTVLSSCSVVYATYSQIPDENVAGSWKINIDGEMTAADAVRVSHLLLLDYIGELHINCEKAVGSFDYFNLTIFPALARYLSFPGGRLKKVYIHYNPGVIRNGVVRFEFSINDGSLCYVADSINTAMAECIAVLLRQNRIKELEVGVEPCGQLGLGSLFLIERCILPAVLEARARGLTKITLPDFRKVSAAVLANMAVSPLPSAAVLGVPASAAATLPPSVGAGQKHVMDREVPDAEDDAVDEVGSVVSNLSDYDQRTQNFAIGLESPVEKTDCRRLKRPRKSESERLLLDANPAMNFMAVPDVALVPYQPAGVMAQRA